MHSNNGWAVGGRDHYRPPMQVDAVIFDWGGTLTRWHDIDFHAESLALAHAVVASAGDRHVHAEALHRANQVIWGRSRDHQQSATVADLFLSLIHISEPTRRTPISYAVFCLK